MKTLQDKLKDFRKALAYHHMYYANHPNKKQAKIGRNKLCTFISSTWSDAQSARDEEVVGFLIKEEQNDGYELRDTSEYWEGYFDRNDQIVARLSESKEK
jgi:hypothetical protein